MLNKDTHLFHLRNELRNAVLDVLEAVHRAARWWGGKEGIPRTGNTGTLGLVFAEHR